MSKVKIGVVTHITTEVNPIIYKVDRIYVNIDYIEAIEKVSATPIMIPIVSSDESLDTYVDICDGFLFTGGLDINPLYYNEEPHPKLGMVNYKLDEFQLKLMKKVLASKKPLLAICRGLQILNVVCGGTLYQDFEQIPQSTIQHQQSGERYNLIHKVNFEKNSILYNIYGEETFVNSFHHQAIKDIGSGLKVIGKAPDGVIEAIELENHDFGLGVQWHPEMMFVHFESVKPLFQALVDASKRIKT